MLNWCPLRNYTHYSLLKGFSKPDELAQKCKQEDYPACGIADYKTISGVVKFYKACKKVGIKPIIGCSFDSCTLFAKNKDGWHDLISLVSSLDNDGNVPPSIWSKVLSGGNIINVPHNKDLADILPVSYYVNSEDAKLHRILLCSELKTTLPKVNKLIHSGELSKELTHQFTHDDLFIITKDKVSSIIKNTTSKNKEYIENIINSCEEYDILSKPMLPAFPCPNGKTEEDYLKELCRIGWKNILIDNDKVSKPEDKEKYLERFKEEFDVIKGANLFGYFLIVQDIIQYVNDQGWLSGPGRGSAAGCLISYLIGITKIDPLEFDLLFSRFYNAGRNSTDHISLPDIDMDVPAKRRDEVLLYLKNKYGHEHVSQMITFGRLQGRSAIKEVLRVNEACSFAEMNAITKSIPNEAEISDQLADMDDEDRSIIRWALINNANELRDFCYINEDGKLDGDYAEYFDQAIKIEGTFKTQGKHAAGVVISKYKLSDVCPMVDQRDSSEKIAGLEMSDLESLGHVKFDVLGLSLLDKLMFIKEIRKQ
jgi:DNA polymerase-3 subunit alpha